MPHVNSYLLSEFNYELLLDEYIINQENNENMAAIYVNGLKFSIQDELSMHRVNSMEEDYQLALKAKEKHNRKYI